MAIYRRNNSIYIHPQDKIDVGAWIAVEPCIEIPPGVTSDELGLIIRENLLESSSNIKPKWTKGLFDFVLKKAKVKSYKQFMSGCRHCHLTQSGSKLILAHSVNKGTKGFAYTSEPSIEIDANVSHYELGENVLECLEKST